MDSLNGLFQVLNYRNDIIGTAFAISYLNEKNQYLLLTAYHVVSESIATKKVILLRSDEGSKFEAIVIYPQNISSKYREYGSDFAILKIDTAKVIDIFELKAFHQPHSCLVRGAIPYYDTMFTTLGGNFYWNEKIYSENTISKKTLQLSLKTKPVFTDGKMKPLDQQEILRGLSGAPIIVESNEKNICAGVMSYIFPDGSASQCYGVPSQNVIDIFDIINMNLGIPKNGDVLTDKTFISNAELSSIANLIFEQPNIFSLENPDVEVETWNKISDLFYKGIAIDSVLEKIIYSNVSINYSNDAIIALRYFYARLLFKRGLTEKAFNEFYEVKNLFRKVSKVVVERMDALINVRSIAEDKKLNSSYNTIDKLKYAADKLINLSSVNDVYKAYEISSMYGRGLINIFSDSLDFSQSEKESICDLLRQHSAFLEKYPKKLCRQEIVNIAIRWLVNIWQLDSSIDYELFMEDISSGFRQSEIRKNSIFHIQSLIAYAILKLIVNETGNATTILLLVAHLMKKERLSLEHEGISQLLLYIKENYNKYYAVLGNCYLYLNVSETKIIDSCGHYIDKNVIRNSLEKENRIFNLNYLNNDLFMVQFNDLKYII